MATLVCLHAHPDDECIGMGGTIARAAAEGHRVVLVVATNGDHGEVPADLADGETLVERRRAETQRSADVLGIARVEWLGYRDSGMTGWEQNEHADSFLLADVDEAAGRLAKVLREERADVLTCYDWHGTYGHPDHIKVHHVGHRAAEMAGVDEVFEVTMNRDVMVQFFAVARDNGMMDDNFDPSGPADDGNPFGEPAAAITLAVDVRAYVAAKRESLACHASQSTDTGAMLAIPPDIFAQVFGTEYYIKKGAPAGLRPGWLFEG